MGHEGRFSRWAEEGAFELSFDVGGVGADLRVLAGEDLSQLSQFHPLGPVLGGRPLWKRLVHCESRGTHSALSLIHI